MTGTIRLQRFATVLSPTWGRQLRLALLLFCFLGCLRPLAAQKGHPFEIVGQLTQVSNDSITLFQYMAGEYYEVVTVPIVRNSQGGGSFTMRNAVPFPALYWVGYRDSPPPDDGLMLILGEDPRVFFAANAMALFETTIIKQSDLNKQLVELMRKNNQWQMELSEYMKLTNYYRNGNAMLAQKMAESTDSVYRVQHAYLENAAKKHKGTLIETVANAYRWLPYKLLPESDKKKYADEDAYFRQAFLDNLDFTNPAISFLPIFHEKVLNYALKVLGHYQLPYLKAVPLLEKPLEQIPEKSRTHESYLLAMQAASAESRYNTDYVDIFLNFSEQYVKHFPDRPGNEQRREQLAKLGKLRIGQEAPDISLTSPDGKKISLSQLRGQYVLIDFWASWCGPCRRENPHVVSTYKKYNDKGFEVFSVSLDKDAARWEKAIEQDNLTWPYHVSDLKGWQSSAAQLYGVSSIPFTLLLDKKGRIIGKNLRGHQLEQKLEQIFAEN